jgi:hypothetical protein
MKRLSLFSLLVVLLLIYPMLMATTAIRGVKPNGSTSWVSGYVNDLTAATLNYDFDQIYNTVNGNLDNTNIASGANIAWTKLNTTGQVVDASVSATAAIEETKIDGYSDNVTELKDTMNAETGTLPASLKEEIMALRYAIQSVFGASTQNGGTLDMEWYLEPTIGDNLLYNGDFEDSADGDLAAAPSGWTLSDCSTITNCDTPDTDTSEGLGHAVQFTSDNDSNDDGLTQALAGLKVGKSYLVMTRAKAASGGVCQLITTGGTTNANATTNSTSYVSLADIFSVAAGPATVTLALTVNDDGAGGDVCNFDHAAVYEMNGDSVGRLNYLPVYKTANSSSVVDDAAYSTNLLTAVVTVPGPNYIIKVNGEICAGMSTTDDFDYELRSRLLENGLEVAESATHEAANPIIFNTAVETVLTSYVNTAPIPGTTYTYVLQARDNDAGGDTFTFNSIAECGTIDQKLLVELVKVN